MSNVTRDQAPAYLAKYQTRRLEAHIQPEPDAIGDEPGFVTRARLRSTERALAELDRADSPPGRTEAFAFESVAPRDFSMPEAMRRLAATSIDVRLIRHGQTQGYVTDAALTPLGRWQARRKGQDLAKGLKEGDTVRFPHAPTARAAETSIGVYEGVQQALARYGIQGVTLDDPTPNPWFKNFQVVRDGDEMDVTGAFAEMNRTKEAYERTNEGERPGWMHELDRFFRILFAGGDPITSWLNIPMHYVEPPGSVVRRHWLGVLQEIEKGPVGAKVYMCGHSGPIRAVAASAVGHDPGEPHNTEDVRIRVLEGNKRAMLTYRGRGVEVEIPVLHKPSWWVN